MSKIDYYEFLQISPNADQDTIHRVYRFLAARYHPDNPQSGCTEKFATLKVAYEVLSNPVKRAEYDLACLKDVAKKVPLSTTIDFMDNMEGETNRRLAVLAVLYFKRRTNPNNPEVTLLEIESRMGFPRDYLDFTTWYLQKKGYITRADNSDFTLTAQGVDFVETQRAHIPVLNRLLTNGADGSADDAARNQTANPLPTNLMVLPERSVVAERRQNRTDRRASPRDRRATAADMRPTG